jgi:hypothetical protein
MTEYNRTASLDFRFYDTYDKDDVNVIYIDEESPSSIFLKFEIENKTGVNLALAPYSKPQNETSSDRSNIVSPDNFHIELRFRPGTLSLASLVQIDLGEYSKEQWLMSRPVFHENKEVSLYFIKHGEPLHLGKTLGSNKAKASLTLCGFAANSAGGARGSNVIINYKNFQPTDDNFKTNETVPFSGTKSLNLTILSHRGKRSAPLSICFATHNTILNNGESTKDNDIELQITNIGSEPMALYSASEFIIEIDGEAERKAEPWAVAKKDEATSFNVTIKDRIVTDNNKSWLWDSEFSSIDKNVDEPRFIFKNIFRRIGTQSVLKSYQEYIELPQKLKAEVIKFTSDPKKPLVAYPGTEWESESGYSFCFQADGNLALYKYADKTRILIWATGTTNQADKLKFYPNGNLVLYHQGKAVWSTQKVVNNKQSRVCLELKEDGNLVLYPQDSKQLLFETNTSGGRESNRNAKDGWKKLPEIDIDDESQAQHRADEAQKEYSFPSNEDLILTISNVKSSLASGQGQIRVYYKNIPGYADGYQVLNLYKTHLIERNKKIGIGKIPDPKIELDVKGTISATEDMNVQGNIKSAKTVSAQSFVGQGAVVKGMIVMWSGKGNDIPSGWQICNGQNGTPDLRGRFIVGAGATEDQSFDKPNASGGPTLHKHRIDPPEVKRDTLKAGGHFHHFPNGWFKKYVKSSGHGGDCNFIDTNGGRVKGKDTDGETTQNAGEHVHPVTVKIPEFYSDSSSEEIRPRWYALCFIMYVGKTS